MKLNNFLQGAEGKYHDLTIYSSKGDTIARKVVTPNDPKSEAQTLQRVIYRAVAMLYAMFKYLCCHSFEGFANGFECMNTFKKLNLNYLRERAVTLQQSGQSLRQFYQFSPLKSGKWTPFAAIISQGSLPKVTVSIDAEGGHKACVNSPDRITGGLSPCDAETQR